MSTEMKHLLKNVTKYDLIAGFIFALIASTLINKEVALIFSLGLLVSVINFLASGYFTEKFLLKSTSFWLPITYVVRILAIILLALPFLNNLIQLSSYLIGYISHFIFVVFYWVKKEKGSD